MPQLLAQNPSVDPPERDPEIVGLADGDSESVFAVLSAERARSILLELYRSPATKSELADRVGTSIQNVSHHLENLAEAGLVDVIDEWYSEKGREMDVYAPDSEPFVLVVGGTEELAATRRSLSEERSPEATPQPGD